MSICGYSSWIFSFCVFYSLLLLLVNSPIRDLAFLNAAELLMAQQRVKPIAVNEFLEDVKTTTGKNFPAGIRGNGTVVQSVSEFVGEVHAQL